MTSSSNLPSMMPVTPNGFTRIPERPRTTTAPTIRTSAQSQHPSPHASPPHASPAATTLSPRDALLQARRESEEKTRTRALDDAFDALRRRRQQEHEQAAPRPHEPLPPRPPHRTTLPASHGKETPNAERAPEHHWILQASRNPVFWIAVSVFTALIVFVLWHRGSTPPLSRTATHAVAETRTHAVLRWRRTQPPTADDKVYVATATAESFVCNAATIFARGKNDVRLRLPGNGPHVVRTVIKGVQQHVCSLQNSNCITFENDGTRCETLEKEDDIPEVVDACTPYA